MAMTKRVLNCLVALLFVGAVVGVFRSPGNQTPERAETAPQEQAGAAESELADIPVYAAVTLAAAYDENEVAANQAYKGVDMYLVGVVTSIGQAGSTTYVVLDGAQNRFLNPQVSFRRGQESAVAQLREGDMIAVRCTGNGCLAGKPMFKNGEFIQIVEVER